MASTRPSLRRSLLFSTLCTLALFAGVSVAQDRDTSATNRPNTNTNANTNPPQNGPTSAPTTARITDTNTNTNTRVTSSAPPMPTITGGQSAGRPNSLPSVTRVVNTDTAIPTYAAAAIPPTFNAPFMRHSTLPQGTVFICVGAILGAFGLAIILWRGIVACLLHRAVERAALDQHIANDKAAFPAPPAPFYKYTDRDSSPNLTAGRGQRRTNRGPIPSATPSQTNLFFSPTAAPGGGMGSTGNRDSRFLPSGFYASNSPVAAHTHSISLTNLRPESRGHPRPVGHSPPESPNFGPARTTPAPRNVSTSTLNLNRPPSGRAPSAFLDELLDDQPHLFPPGGPDPHHRSPSQPNHNRF